ncbi:hypothetical protein PFFVO_02397 [Plasmodium falciparum Vietnam Oak-Knoll (FVO)]|uniref:V-SNARE coiled-coil homology domain-containing protein n=1 Tax=Plasmodium falciparum Vietnam Oak-Knoll (FVO) TaxID=1036723 RepID=A0A024V646_PLAFA|nr:hypothetical protein PFFVO_02397 [Plasmodium falciparum Vietnam Oak-Knoll (FVO)]
MNLLAIFLTKYVEDVIFLCNATDLNSYSFIKKKAFKEAAFFVARTIPSRDPLNCDAITQTNIKINENIEKVRVTMDALIRNRENLDVLVDKSKDLSCNV